MGRFVHSRTLFFFGFAEFLRHPAALTLAVVPSSLQLSFPNPKAARHNGRTAERKAP
jgi:hypothetical protein